MGEKSRPSIFWAMAAIMLPLFKVIVRLRIVDGRKMPRTGPLIIAPNHYSEVDPLIIGRAVWRMGRAPRFLAKASLFGKRGLGWVLRRSGQVPVERSGATRGQAPLAAAQELIDHGRAVIVYPEGSLTRDPQMWPMRGRTGAARLALMHGIPVVPVAHWGTQNLLGRYSRKIRLFPRTTIRVKVGDPVDLSAFADRPLDAATLASATDAIMADITGLLADLREAEPPSERWDPKKHNQKETGRFEG